MKKTYIDIGSIREQCKAACERICREAGIDEIDVNIKISPPSARGRHLQIEVVERPSRINKNSPNWTDN